MAACPCLVIAMNNAHAAESLGKTCSELAQVFSFQSMMSVGRFAGAHTCLLACRHIDAADFRTVKEVEIAECTCLVIAVS
jgi:hypothetical protein